MRRGRIESFVEESWGCATVYSAGPNIIPEEVNDTKETTLAATDSEVINTLTVLQPIAEVESIQNDSPKKCCLSYFMSSLYATIMEDALTKIRILMECNNELRIIKTLTDMKKLMALKFGIKQKTNTDELENIDPKNLACEEYKIVKLDADRNYVAQTIIATYIDLCFNRSYVALESSIHHILEHDEYRMALEEEETKNKTLRRELNKQLRQQRNHIKAVMYESNMIIEKLKAQVEDSVIFTECRSRYTDKWQVARTEQHIQTINETEVVSTEILDYYKLKTDHEQRVHAEMELLINIIINETLERIEDWMKKYDEDMEKVDMKIRVKRTDYQNMRDKRIGLENIIDEHDKMMKEWCNFKEIREQQRLYREKMNKSAIMVQAWWRGLLVRRKLGPFRVGKRGRGRGKKK